MSSPLQQLSLSFFPQEDRLLLTIGTRDEAEYRLWLTRRYVKILWRALVKALENHPQVKAQIAPEAKRAVMSFQHEKAVRSSEFVESKRPEKTAEPAAPEEQPLLVTGLKLGQNKREIVRLIFQTRDSLSVTVNLNQALLHSLCHMLIQTTVKAKWDLDLTLGDRAPAAAARPSRVH